MEEKRECELCGKAATHYCTCTFCRDEEWTGSDADGRWLCDECAG